MNPKTETKVCQNCKSDFVIEPEDFRFYEKIKVPPPTFCPWCRFIRRKTWRNDRVLYKRDCDMCHKSVISVHPADVSFPVYCAPCWWSDKWDPADYAQDYDFSRPFFEQFKDLCDKVPRFNLWQRNVINSDYSNNVGESKNVYLSSSVVLGSENVFYSKSVDSGFNVFDSINIKKCENCYENIEGDQNYNSQHLHTCRSCIDSFFLFDCVNCSNCFMSSNLRNKQYYIRNKQYSREEYLKEMERINLSKRSVRNELVNEFKNLMQISIHKFANSVNAINSTGNNIKNAKNCNYCFDVYDAENLKYCERAFISKDGMDYDYGLKSELMYEYVTGGLNSYNVKFSYFASNSQNVEYSISCNAIKNAFGCVGARSRDYVIFNKQYTKEVYEELVPKIIQHMNDMPYIDRKGRVYKYGEFFPVELSPFAYNETPAQEFEYLDKDKAISMGYSWKPTEEKDHQVTLNLENIPDDIAEVGEEILSEVIECSNKGQERYSCFKFFRITNTELVFYQKNNIPIPVLCPNCRHYQRIFSITLPRLYHRSCTCAVLNHGHDGQCANEFETSYAPDRPEKVYCESCYNREIY